MRFRPCIDIHNGQVKQIVGGSLKDEGDRAQENFVAWQDGAFYAGMYKDAGLKGGHIILLNGKDSPHYEATKDQAILALKAYPGGLQVGGGITPENGSEYLEAGASHVIVTSYVFKDGQISWDNLHRMEEAVGANRLVLDLSCRKRDGKYYVVTDRWQKFTDVEVTTGLLKELGSHCDEFLVHGVDVEGKTSGIEENIVKVLAQYGEKPMTYAGGVSTYNDLKLLKELGENRVDVTIGSALDIFGGALDYKKVLQLLNEG